MPGTKNVIGMTGLIMVILLAANAFAESDDATTTAATEIPDKVLAAFNKAYPDIKATMVEKEEMGGRVYYEFEIKVDGAEKDIIYLEDGTLYAIEEEIPVKDLPTAVTEALKETYPEGEIDEAEKITRGDDTEYEAVVEIEEGDKEVEYEVIITSGGEITSKEIIEDEGDGEEVDDEEEVEEENDDD